VGRLVRTVDATPETRLLEVRDEVLEMHQCGKIAVRSRYDISSLGSLRRVYTPGVAEGLNRDDLTGCFD
jgi:malate dehydrogenase (oxaloacetate-decarboxylating)